MRILIGSENPVKVEATREAFSHYFDEIIVTGISVNSKVSNQPFNDVTFEGARNRALALRSIDSEQGLHGQFFVGLEGGIAEHFSRWFVFGAVCIIDSHDHVGFGTSPHLEIPHKLVSRLTAGVEFGDLIDEIVGEVDTKRKQGAIGLLTHGIMTRKDFYSFGLTCALVSFLNKGFFER